jgi:hypothetical protein
VHFAISRLYLIDLFWRKETFEANIRKVDSLPLQNDKSICKTGLSFFIEESAILLATYGTHSAAISIDSLKILEGSLPPRILGLVIEWASEHRKELENNWKRREKGQDLKKIKPLV